MPPLPASIPLWVFAIPPAIFAFAGGACIGSFLNVVVHRLPRGEPIVVPSSRCPSCSRTLTWRENLPVLGWLLLRGRCRGCRARISAEYPIVELATALLFGGMYLAWFVDLLPPGWASIGSGDPDWASDGLRSGWPLLVSVLILFGALISASLIDARTFTIPIAIPWIAAALCAAIAVFYALAIDLIGALRAPQGWIAPLPTGPALGASLGAMLGVVLANALMTLRLIPRSYADYETWERKALERAHESADQPSDPEPEIGVRSILLRTTLLCAPAIGLMYLGVQLGLRIDRPLEGLGIGAIVGLAIGVTLRSLLGATQSAVVEQPARAPERPPRPLSFPAIALLTWTPALVLGGLGSALGIGEALALAGLGLLTGQLARIAIDPALGGQEANDGPQMWLVYPHARRETLRELLFLLPIIAAAILGWWLWPSLGPAEPALTLRAAGGASMGFCVAGGLVWAVRILGTLAIGQEAMGMGDVHLMAAAGAALGWIDPTLAFFVAPLFGIGFAISGALVRRGVRAAIPFGPSLALATIAVVVAKPGFEGLLSALMGKGVDLP